MKTRLIAVIIIGVVFFGSFSFVYALMYDCLNPPMWMKVPRTSISYCWGLFLNGHLPDYTKAREDHKEKQSLKTELIQRYKNEPEVKAFYSKYDDANVSVRDDHMSYFAGSEDDWHVRMNMFFDENYELDNIDFHCYFQREHQFEFPQEDIATKISKYECKKYGT